MLTSQRGLDVHMPDFPIARGMRVARVLPSVQDTCRAALKKHLAKNNAGIDPADTTRLLKWENVPIDAKCEAAASVRQEYAYSTCPAYANLTDEKICADLKM